MLESNMIILLGSVRMLQQMITRTAPEPKFALVEKKGLGPDKRRVLELLEETKLEVVVV